MANSPNWQNRTLFIADNIFILRGMASESVDCIATDPPFNAKRVFNAPLGSRSAAQRFDDRWRWDEVTDEWHDLIALDHPSVKEIIEAAVLIEGGTVDRLSGRIDTGRVLNSIAAFIAYMAPRVVEMHRILKSTGVLFLQCDWEANAYLRLLLDAVFGRALCINEIVRRRTAAKGLATRRLPVNHDMILAYGKGPKWTWRQSFAPYDLANLDAKTERQYSHFDRDGRRYQLDNLANPNRDRPNLTYEFLGIRRVWRWTKERMEHAYQSGRIYQKAPGYVPRFIRYLDEQPGRPRDTLWTDCVQPETSDAVWNTRKPAKLYSRLIACATDRDDMVLDPFAGCATTCVAAEKSGRDWVGIDIDPVAEQVTKDRLADEAGLNMQIAPVVVRKSLAPTNGPIMPDVKLRSALWRNQGRRCGNPYCDSRNLRAVDLELDHRIPRVRGGADDPHNRVGLCGNCNRRKGRKAWGTFLDSERRRQPHPSVEAHTA